MMTAIEVIRELVGKLESQEGAVERVREKEPSREERLYYTGVLCGLRSAMLHIEMLPPVEGERE